MNPFFSYSPLPLATLITYLFYYDYRLVARISYEYKHVLIKWIGTHAEYNKINVLEV